MADSSPPPVPAGQHSHIVAETGLTARLVLDGLAAQGQVSPELHVPGTQVLRTSVLATWADVLTGVLSLSAMPGRVPVTLDLVVNVVAPVTGCPVVDAHCTIIKAGVSVVVLGVDFSSAGRQVARATAAFVPSPDLGHTMPPLSDVVERMARSTAALQVPYAERAACARQTPGVAVLQRRADGLNAANTVNGALLALVVEEAVLSASPIGGTLASLALRYLRPVRTGPAVATARVDGSFAEVEVRDEGAGDRLAITATTRTA